MHTSGSGVLVHYLTSGLVLCMMRGMPNLVVYVPASVARALVVLGVSEDLQRRACREVLEGLAGGELGAGEPETTGVVVAGAVQADAVGPVASVTAARKPASPAPSSFEKRSFRPDPKRK